MNLHDLEKSFGASLHDAGLRSVSIDYRNRTATLVVDVSCGDPDASTSADRERRRLAQLELGGVHYLAIEAPDPGYPYRRAGSVDMGSCAPDEVFEARYPEPRPAFTGRLFVSDWNSFVHIAASTAALAWIEQQ